MASVQDIRKNLITLNNKNKELIDVINKVTGNVDTTLSDSVDSFVTVFEDQKVVLQEKTITENGTYIADDGFDALSKIVVNVPVVSDTDASKYSMVFTENLGVIINGKVINTESETFFVETDDFTFSIETPTPSE